MLEGYEEVRKKEYRETEEIVRREREEKGREFKIKRLEGRKKERERER